VPGVPSFYAYASVTSAAYATGTDVVISRDDTKVREYGRYSADVLFTADVGEGGTVTDRNGRFLEVRFSQQEGWVSGDWIAPADKYQEWIAMREQRQQDIQNAEERIRVARSELPVVSEQVDALRERQAALEDSVRNQLELLSMYNDVGYYFEGLPQGEASTKTNASGEFSMTLQQGTPYYLVARADRPSVEESYHCIAYTTLTDSENQFFLSNDNKGYLWDHIGESAEDELFTLLEVAKATSEELDWRQMMFRAVIQSEEYGPTSRQDIQERQAAEMSGNESYASL
jgi:hypothetical protein